MKIHQPSVSLIKFSWSLIRRIMNTFNRVALEVLNNVRSHVSVSDKDAEWQRVNTYIADVLKDAHVLYAKLARLQGDFGGEELNNLEKISEDVLEIGTSLSSFSKAFYDGNVSMSGEEAFGEQESSPSLDFMPSMDVPGDSDDSKSEDSSDDEGEGSDVDVEFDYETPEKSPKDDKK